MFNAVLVVLIYSTELAGFIRVFLRKVNIVEPFLVVEEAVIYYALCQLVELVHLLLLLLLFGSMNTLKRCNGGRSFNTQNVKLLIQVDCVAVFVLVHDLEL